MTVVSHFREILNCELRKGEKEERERERDRAGEYRRDMHYTMDARFSRLISLNSTVPPPLPRGIARYRSRKSNLRKYTHAHDVRCDVHAAVYKYGRANAIIVSCR